MCEGLALLLRCYEAVVLASAAVPAYPQDESEQIAHFTCRRTIESVHELRRLLITPVNRSCVKTP